MLPQPSASPLTATAPCTAFHGIIEATGQQLSSRALAKRVGWAIDLVQEMTGGLLADHWNPADVAQLTGGIDHTGRRLPSQACMALRRLGWAVEVPAGVRVNDRVVRMAQEAAGRILRSATWRAGLIEAVVTTWPADPDQRTPVEWDALRSAVPGGQGHTVATGILGARTRQAAEFLGRHGRLPRDVFELESPPRAPRQLLLAPVTSSRSPWPAARRTPAGSRCSECSFRPGRTLGPTGTGPGWRCGCGCRRPSRRTPRCTCPPSGSLITASALTYRSPAWSRWPPAPGTPWRSGWTGG